MSKKAKSRIWLDEDNRKGLVRLKEKHPMKPSLNQIANVAIRERLEQESHSK